MADITIEQNDDLTVIQIDYAPGTHDPSRVFRSMAGLIDACHRIDRDLAHSVAATFEPELLLERIEAGSIRAVLRAVLTQVDDDALKGLDWKPLVGQYLVRGKHLMLKWLDGRSRITDRREVLGLQEELQAIAPTTGTLLPPAPISVKQLLLDIESISQAVQPLQDGDSATFISQADETRIETGIRITEREIEALLTESVTRNTTDDIQLLVKKPDYLGNSMWEFRYDDHVIEAKILDLDWLGRFRAAEVQLQPGDSLRVMLRTETARGFEGQEVAARHEVLRVHGVIRLRSQRQPDLLQ